MSSQHACFELTACGKGHYEREKNGILALLSIGSHEHSRYLLYRRSMCGGVGPQSIFIRLTFPNTENSSGFRSPNDISQRRFLLFLLLRRRLEQALYLMAIVRNILNAVYILFFVVHFPVTLLFDTQALYPTELVPSVLKKVTDDHVLATRDPLFAGNAGLTGDASYLWAWFRSFIGHVRFSSAL